MTKPARNRDVKPVGTFDHPTQFAAKENTGDDIALSAAPAFEVGQMVNLDVNGNRLHGDIQRIDPDGVHTVLVIDAHSRYTTVTATADDLQPSEVYAADDNVWVTDYGHVSHRGWVIGPTSTGWYAVRVEDRDTWRHTVREAYVSDMKRMTTADLAKDCPDTWFPRTHPELPGHNWGINYSFHHVGYDISHGYRGEWDVPADTVGWETGTTDAGAADVIWGNRDHITAALRERGLGGQRVYVAIAVEDNGDATAVYRDGDEMVSFPIHLER